MKLYCDNKSAINIAHNSMQYDCTKHVKVDGHFIKGKLENGLICTPFVSTRNQLAELLTKGLPGAVFQNITSKLGMEGGVSEDKIYFLVLSDGFYLLFG